MRPSVCHLHGFVLPGDLTVISVCIYIYSIYFYIYSCIFIFIYIYTLAYIQNMVAHIYIGVDRCRNIHPYQEYSMLLYMVPPQRTKEKQNTDE